MRFEFMRSEVQFAPIISYLSYTSHRMKQPQKTLSLKMTGKQKKHI